MKALVKATGEIVEVSQGIYYPYQYVDNNGTIYTEEEIEILQEVLDSTIDYWTRLEHQYAGMAMQGIMANSLFMPYDGKEIADISNNIATALVEKLKGESNG